MPFENTLHPVSQAAGSKAFSCPSHTHHSQHGCRVPRRSLMRFAYYFLNPLCKRTIAITVVQTFTATLATQRKQTELPLGVVQDSGKWGIWGYSFLPQEQRALPAPSLDYPLQSTLGQAHRTGRALNRLLPPLSSTSDRKGVQRTAGQRMQKRPVCPGAESTCGAAIVGMSCQGHPDVPPKPSPLSLRCHHPLPNAPSLKPTRPFPFTVL